MLSKLPTQRRTIGYLRVSTSEQTRSGLGLSAQERAIKEYATRCGLHVDAVVTETASGATADRPALAALLDALQPSDKLIVARLDRLTRSLLQFAEIVDRANRDRWTLVVVDQGFDLATPAGRAMAGMFAVFATYERELIALRTREAIRALPRHRRNGRPVYSEAARRRARCLRAAGLSLRQIAAILASEGTTPPRGGSAIRPSTVSRLLEDA